MNDIEADAAHVRAVHQKLLETETKIWIVADETHGDQYIPRVFTSLESAKACLRVWVQDRSTEGTLTESLAALDNNGGWEWTEDEDNYEGEQYKIYPAFLDETY